MRGGAAAAFAAVLLWGFSPIGARFMVGAGTSHLPALAFNALRYAIAALVFTPFWPRLRRWDRADLGRGVVLGLIGVAGFAMPTVLGQRSTTAGMTGLLDGAEPLLIMVIGAGLARTWPRRFAVPASVLGVSGIVLLAQGGGPALGDAKGIALVLLGAALWALYCVLAPGLIARRGALAVSALTMGVGALPLLAAGLPQMPALLHRMGWLEWRVTLALALGATAMSMLLWNVGSGALGAQRAGWFLYLIPLVSVAGGAVLLGEPVKLVELLGGGMILVSVFLAEV